MRVSRLSLVLALGTAIVAISFAAIFIRLAQAEGVPALSIAAWRLTFASLLMLPYALATRRDEIRSLYRRELALAAASGVFLGLHFATWGSSLDYTSVASSVVLVTTGPIFVGLGSWLLLGERPNSKLAVGIVIAATGSIIVSWSDLTQSQSHLLGDLLALSGAIMIAGYFMIGRKLRAHHSLVTYTALVYTAAALALLAFALIGRQSLLGLSLPAYGWMLLMALVPQLIGHSALNWALRHLSATYVAIVTLAEPIGSSILAYVILREATSLSTALGGAVILTGIYIASRAELARKP
ncbi:MAG: DMT family transporter [Anaerolineae bacterium]